MLNVALLKQKVAQIPVEAVLPMIEQLQATGLVNQQGTPFRREHFNICFAEIEALLQRAGYHKQIDVLGYQGKAYALFDPSKRDAVEVLRALKNSVERATALVLAN